MVDLLRSEKKDAGWRTTGIEGAIVLRQQKVVKQSESRRATQIHLRMKVLAARSWPLAWVFLLA